MNMEKKAILDAKRETEKGGRRCSDETEKRREQLQ